MKRALLTLLLVFWSAASWAQTPTPDVPPQYDNPTLDFASSCYTATGTTGHVMTGFSPRLLIVRSKSYDIAVFKTSAMPSTTSATMAGGTVGTNAITGFDDTGFTIGTDDTVNVAGRIYCWYAWNDTVQHLAVGSYTGNGTTQSPTVGLAGEVIRVVWVRSATAGTSGVMNTADLGTDSLKFGSSGVIADGVTGRGTNTFTVGADATVNSNGVTYYWVAWSQESSSVWDRGTYTGDGGANRDITTTCAPKFVFSITNDGKQGRFAADRSEYPVATQFTTATYGTKGGVRGFSTATENSYRVGQDLNAIGDDYYWFAGCTKRSMADGTIEHTDTGTGSEALAVTTPTLTPTPSSTPTPSITPTATNTPTRTWTPTPTATYVVVGKIVGAWKADWTNAYCLVGGAPQACPVCLKDTYYYVTDSGAGQVDITNSDGESIGTNLTPTTFGAVTATFNKDSGVLCGGTDNQLSYSFSFLFGRRDIHAGIASVTWTYGANTTCAGCTVTDVATMVKVQ